MRNKKRNSIDYRKLEEPSYLLDKVGRVTKYLILGITFYIGHLETLDSFVVTCAIFFILYRIYETIKIKDSEEVKELIASVDSLKTEIQSLKRRM